MTFRLASLFITPSGDRFVVSTQAIGDATEYRIHGPSSLPKVCHLLREFKLSKTEEALTKGEMDQFISMLVEKGFQIEVPST